MWAGSGIVSELEVVVAETCDRPMAYAASGRWEVVHSDPILGRFPFSGTVKSIFISNIQQLLQGCGFLGLYVTGYP